MDDLFRVSPPGEGGLKFSIFPGFRRRETDLDGGESGVVDDVLKFIFFV